MSNTHEKKQDQEQQSIETAFQLILHNDEVNSFDYIIESLMDILEMRSESAEQCAIITHYKGKTDVKTGTLKVLKNYKAQFDLKGIQVTIEEKI